MIVIKNNFKKFAPLLALGALFVALYATQPVATQATPVQPPLQLTEVRGTVPNAYNEIFPIQWGGGSLYQLKARLATKGCMADTIWVHNAQQGWFGYNSYQTDFPRFLNNRFLQQYESFIPAGTLFVTCFRVCEMEYANSPVSAEVPKCITYEDERQLTDPNNQTRPFFDPIFEDIDCTQNFKYFTAPARSILPTQPDLCVVYLEIEPDCGNAPFYLRAERCQEAQNNALKLTFGFFEQEYWQRMRFGDGHFEYEIYPNTQPVIAIHSPKHIQQDQQHIIKTLVQHIEIHEACHAQQNWYITQMLRPDVLQTAHKYDMWLQSVAGQEFLNLVGYYEGVWGLKLPQQSIYQNIYTATDPQELAAELCAMYLVDALGEQTPYTHIGWDETIGAPYWRNEPIEFNVNQYLTPQVRNWLETWVMLPQV